MSEPTLETINQKIDILIERQTVIKAQVEKTNGRVTVLERFMNYCIGGFVVFSALNLPRFIQVLFKGL